MSSLYPINAPLFTVRMWTACDGAEMIEIWSEPSLVTFRDDGSAVTIQVATPYGTEDPGILSDTIHHDEFLCGDRLDDDEIATFRRARSKPQPWRVEYPRNQGEGLEGPPGSFTLVAVGPFFRIGVHLSEEAAMIVPADCVGLDMRGSVLFLNADGSELPEQGENSWATV